MKYMVFVCAMVFSASVAAMAVKESSVLLDGVSVQVVQEDEKLRNVGEESSYECSDLSSDERKVASGDNLSGSDDSNAAGANEVK